MLTTSSIFSAGTVVGGEFVVVRPLREGGMGAVYVVEQKSTGKRRALKVMHREIVAVPEMRQRFETEALVGARIASEHVVEVLAAGVDTTTSLPYLVMELLEGEDLRQRLDRSGALSLADVGTIFEQLSHAIGAAHAAGVVHRDLKPENVFLARLRRAGGGAPTVKVLDFGIAKLAMEAGTRATHGTLGSPLWMAPEQTTPEPVTPAADVWALGLLAYELFTGRSFWRTANLADGTTAQLLREIVLDEIPSATARAASQGVADRLPAGFDPWFSRCVAREPAARFQDAAQSWKTMQRMFGSAPSTSSVAFDETGAATPFVTPPAPNLPRETPMATVHEALPRPSRRLAPILGVAIGVFGLAGGALLARRTQPSNPVPAVAISIEKPSTTPSVVASVAPSAATSEMPSAVAPPASTAAPRPPPKPSSSPLRTVGGGFSDPANRDARTTQAVTWRVQGRDVRLFTRLVSNDSNVADRVVRGAVEWSSWQYLRCYERAFGGSKELPEGVVTVRFEILEQLPRHATLEASTIESELFNECVVGTLTGQTINAAGPDGKGPAVESFRFVPMD